MTSSVTGSATPRGIQQGGQAGGADLRRARSADGLLRVWNDAGVLDLADIHVARCLADLGEETDERVVLAAALAVRAPRLGHVCVDITTVRTSTVTEGESADVVATLPWPEPAEWLEALAASPLVTVGGDRSGDPRPLRLTGELLYLDRYWQQERFVAVDLLARSRLGATPLDPASVDECLDRLFGAESQGDGLPRQAAASALRHRLAVIAGGPGTGKTTTVARLLALFIEQSVKAGRGVPRIALTAPTGKAAARLQEAVRAEAAELDIDDSIRQLLAEVQASTLHRLLGWRPGSRSRFRHDRTNHLPHDLVVVDETSMVSLSLMARLLEAVRSDAHLVLVGDPHQLASVEAGAVLGDIVGPAGQSLAVSGEEVSPGKDGFGQGISVLRRVFRYGGTIAALSSAILAGDEHEAVHLLRGDHHDLAWIETEPEAPATADAEALKPIRQAVVTNGERTVDAARRGDAAAAMEALSELRILCAHREGLDGVRTWTSRIERWLGEAIPGYGAGGPWYLGRPLLVTENDYELGLYNGDTGVVIAEARAAESGITARAAESGMTADAGDSTRSAVFERRGQIASFAPTRLKAVESVHAMTIHKSQGSQYGSVGIVLPDQSAAILTRQLFYTAVTRAQKKVTIVGSEAAVRAAVARPIARASGLGPRLWS